MWLALEGPASGEPVDAATTTSAELDAKGGELFDPLGQGLVVKVSDTIPEHELLRGWIEDRGYMVLGRSGHVLERTDLIRVVVKGGPFDYRITLRARRHGQDLPDPPEPIVCACGSEEMLEVLGQAIAAAAVRIADAARAEREAERAALAAKTEVACRARTDDAVASAMAVADERRRYRPTGLGTAGLVSLGLGAGLFMGGVGLTQSTVSPSTGWSSGAKAMVSIGSITLVSGLTMLVVDLARCKRGSARCGRLANRAAWRGQPVWAAGKEGRG